MDFVWADKIQSTLVSNIYYGDIVLPLGDGYTFVDCFDGGPRASVPDMEVLDCMSAGVLSMPLVRCSD